MRFVAAHPRRKNKSAPKVGHPAKGGFHSRSLDSAIAAGGFDDHGENAGFVAGYEQRDMAVDSDLSLKQLLAGGIYIRRISERDVSA